MSHNGEMESTAEPAETLKNLTAGDALEVWGEGNRVVTTAFKCIETMDEREYRWSWYFLDDGSLLEVSPDGYFRYTEHEVFEQATARYEELVAQDGALVRFEERVREGNAVRRPVHVTFGNREYRIASSGTVTVQRVGAEPELRPWNAFSSRADQNVYFGLVSTEDESQVGLGIWTDHVCVSFGTEFDPADVVGIYRRER